MATRDAETRAEAVAHGGSSWGENPIVDFIRKSPFLFLSLLFHGILLGFLASIAVQEAEPVQRRISLELEPPDETELEPRPLKADHHLDPKATELALDGIGPDRDYDAELEKTDEVTIDRPDVGPMDRTIPPGDTRDFDEEGITDDAQIVSTRTPDGGIDPAVDRFAVATINAITTGRTLVVLMVDRSRSVIYGDLPRLTSRMDHYFSEIEHNLFERLEGRGYWQVVSYGREPRFVRKPSSNLTYVQNALKAVEIGTSGEENVGAAVELVLDRFAGAGYDHILIAAMTDEAGDDIRNPVMLQRVINRLRKNNAQFYVFGHESVFCARRKRVQLKLEPDAMRAGDRDAIRGFEGQTIHGWADGGPESPRPELWWGQNWHRWQRWGATLNNLPSGFGMYALNRMVLASGGQYFLLKKDSDYDQQKLYAKYKPDITSVFEYDRRMRNDRLRRELNATWNEIGTFYLPCDLRSDRSVEKSLRAARRGRDYCISRARELSGLISQSQPREHNWTRWMAHAELTRAELLRLRFMLGQYYSVLREARSDFGNALRQRKKRILMRRGKAPEDYMGPERARRERELAATQISLIIDKHSETPWAVLAKRMQKHLHPWTASLADWPEDRPDRRTGRPDFEF